MSDAEATAINNRGLGLMGQFNYPDAIAAFQEVVDARPDLLDVKVNLLIATFNRQLDGDEAQAVAMTREVLQEQPNHARAHYCLGLLLYRAGELAQATEHYQKALELKPNDPYAMYSVAQCLEQQGKIEDALGLYEKVIDLDPLLRSTYYRASQVNRRLGNEARAEELNAQFERLNDNPQSRLIETKYTRMGPLAEAVAIMTNAQPPKPLPDGPVFAGGEAIRTTPAWTAFRTYEADARVSISACDINGDGKLDLFVADAVSTTDTSEALEALTQGGNVVLMALPDGSYSVASNHPLADVAGVTAALWGDIDNNGLVDAYLCRNGLNQLWMQSANGEWTDRTDEFGVAGADVLTRDGALIDADHDGDLDILLIQAAGRNELLNNNRDGTFRAIGEETGIAGDGKPSLTWVADDFDRRRDLDLLIFKNEPPNEVYLNDRGWSYRSDDAFAGLLAENIDAAVAADVDADGQVELFVLTQADAVSEWRPDERGVWVKVRSTDPPREFGPVPPMIAVIDVDGDGMLDCVHTTAHGWRAIRLDEKNWGEVMYEASEPTSTHLVGLAPIASHDGRGYAMVGVRNGAAPLIWKPGSGRHSFVPMLLAGGEDVGNSMRSNFSGIGTRISARVADTWTVVRNIRQSSGPGQSLQPIMIGLGGHEKIDFVQLDWPDGLFQTELAIAPGEVQTIAEKQRQVSSCPVLFAWDGEKYRFITDLLGVGGMGYMVAPGSYAPPRPWERVLLPEGVLQPRDGKYEIKLSEPMEEACYLDAVQLLAVDLPEGWNVTVDDRMGISDPQPTGELLYYREKNVMLPSRAFNDRGEDLREMLREADRKAAPVGEHDTRFLGRLKHENIITLEFSRPLTGGVGQPVLVIDGWVEYPYSQTMFAAWQAGATYDAPTLEARSANGEWQIVYEQFGYPAGMPRQMALPIDPARLPEATTQLRLRTNQEVYWDRIAVVRAEPCEHARVTTLKPTHAELTASGYAKRTDGPQRLPTYDYADREPFFDMRRQAGAYTQVGSVDELVADADGAMAIFGPGEEVHVEFAAPTKDWSRRVFILDAFGWCKDMDLYTEQGETIAPLPTVERPTPNLDALHGKYNTRYLSGY